MVDHWPLPAGWTVAEAARLADELEGRARILIIRLRDDRATRPDQHPDVVRLRSAVATLRRAVATQGKARRCDA